MRVYSRQELASEIERIAADGYCADIAEMALEARSHLTPPEDIGTIECAEASRYFRSPKGDKKFLWSRKQTPYLLGPAYFGLDDPTCREVIMPKPGRSGGTALFECYEHMLMKYGPMPDMLIYLGSDSEVDSYCDKGFRYLFEDHPDIKAKVGTGRSDDKLKAKKVSGRSVEVLQANNKTVTGRQAAWMRVDELDTFPKALCSNFLEQTRIRGRQLGSHRKVGITSHPDMGWASGVAQAWTMSSKGIFIMQCPNCGGHASPYPTKFWPDVPRFRLVYDKQPKNARWTLSKRLKVAEQTATMQCPHCNSGLDDKQRFAMVDEASAGPMNGWMHEGQWLDVQTGIMGEPDENPARGFWIHGLMVKAITNAELARDLEGATAHYETTRKTDKLRQVLAKVFAEIFEGAGAGQDLDSAGLQKRAQVVLTDADVNEDLIFRIGRCPPSVRFITAAVDVGHGKFDISFRGWDLESRSWWIDRSTLTQRLWPDGVWRELRPTDRIDDWDVLYEMVIDRKFPIVGRPGWAMPVAVVTIDSGDGNSTWKAREFARRSIRAGRFWGKRREPWAVVKLIKGAKPKDAPPIPVVPRTVDKDEHGHPAEPIIQEFDLGVYGLKEQSIERLGVSDGGPGQCEFADGIAAHHFDEYFGETLKDGKWERSGPNESLDLFGYEEAGRQILRPDRKDIKWDEGILPVWATPVPVSTKGGDQAVAASTQSPAINPPLVPKKPSILDRFDQLNRSK